MAYAHVPDAQWEKLDKKAKKLRFVGYTIQSKCYILFGEETSRIYVRRNVLFKKQDFGHGTTRHSRRSPPETVEVQPTSDGLLKGEEQANNCKGHNQNVLGHLPSNMESMSLLKLL